MIYCHHQYGVDTHRKPVGFTLPRAYSLVNQWLAYSFALNSSRTILGKFLQLLVVF